MRVIDVASWWQDRGVEPAVVIRDFAPCDQSAVRSLIIDGLAEHWGSIDSALNRDLDDIAASYGCGRTLVALDGERPVATGTLVPVDEKTAEVVRMSVARDVRYQGVGREILQRLIDTARAWCCERVVLETSAHWTAVIKFYTRCGFTVTHEAEGEFGRNTWFELRL